MSDRLTLGSLFDGSGGFPLAGIASGIDPVWASEIAPFPTRVTEKRMPFVKHYGDVNKLSGAGLEPVDIITFGSPCQDLSIAGKQKGLDGARSGLFHQAIRIIKEMRSVTNGKQPRYIVWENVPGAFSSSGGEDFRKVLEEVCGIKDRDAVISRPAKWSDAGLIVGDGYSVCWRVLDARFWGVPQRRRRIFLVGDLDSERAGEILFESEGVSGYPPQVGKPGQGTPGGTETCPGKTGSGTVNGQTTDGPPLTLKIRCGKEGGGKGALIQTDLSATLATNNDQTLFEPRAWDGSQVSPTLTANNASGSQRMPDKENFNCVIEAYGICAYGSNAMKSDNPHSGIYEAETTRTLDSRCGDPSCNQGGIAVVAIEGNGVRPSHRGMGFSKSETMYTLNATEQHAVFATSTGSFMKFGEEVCPSLCARDDKDPMVVNETAYSVRRLLPVECARLQGFPDVWCDDLGSKQPTSEELDKWVGIWAEWNALKGVRPRTKAQVERWLKDPYSDAEAYRLWGNGVCLPCVRFVLSGIKWHDEKEKHHESH